MQNGQIVPVKRQKDIKISTKSVRTEVWEGFPVSLS